MQAKANLRMGNLKTLPLLHHVHHPGWPLAVRDSFGDTAASVRAVCLFPLLPERR
jgi:hypothetical protein